MTDEQRLLQLIHLRDRTDTEINRLQRKLQSRTIVRRPDRQKIAACGTPSGYYRHLRIDHTPACDQCKAAHRVDERLRQLRNRERRLREQQEAAA